VYEDKRRHQRVRAGYRAAISVEGLEIPVSTINLSLKGMLCTTDVRLKVGQHCRVRLQLGRDVRITIEARVLRMDDAGVGLAFEGLDEESFLHLHRLVQLNFGDGDAISQELTPSRQ
jgi:hypothetical protein